MTFFDLIQARRSVRLFTEEPVSESQLRAILEAATRGPSAGNLQAYRIFAVTDPAVRQALALAAYAQHYVSHAPLVLLFCADPERSRQKYSQRGADLFALQDATIACTYAQLAATALGLGSVWIGSFDEIELSLALDLPEKLIPVALLPIGHPREEPDRRERRNLDEVVQMV